MSLHPTKSLRFKRKDSDTDSANSASKRKHSFSNLFKRHSTSHGESKESGQEEKPVLIPKSKSMRSKSKRSFDFSALNIVPTRSAARVLKSKSVPNNLLTDSAGDTLDLSQLPPLPSVKPIKPARSKKQEFEAVRRKLIGNHSNGSRSSFRSKTPLKSLVSHDDASAMSIRSNMDDSDAGDDRSFSSNSLGGYDDDEYDDDDVEGADLDHHYDVDLSKHFDASQRPSIKHRRLNKLRNKTHLRFNSSTPNHSDSSVGRGDDGGNTPSGKPSHANGVLPDHANASSSGNDDENNTREHNGLFSTLLNSFNLKSFTDITTANHLGPSVSNPSTITNNTDIRSVNSSNSSEIDAKENIKDPINAVSFVPVKKALITTLGEGSLTLDAFPKNQTKLLHEDTNKVILNKTPMNTSDANYARSDVHNELNGSAAEGNAPTRPGQASNQDNTRPQPMIKSRSSLSPLPRRPTFKGSRTSGITSDEEDQSALPMSNSLSFRRKLKLPLAAKRHSTDLSRHSTNDEEVLDTIFSENIRGKDLLFEKLDIKQPNDKRQEAFHALFPNLAHDELLIEDFTCAYRKDLLIQGKLYLSEHHLCFHSNIIGLVTRLVIPLSAILKMQKKKTVGIPNAIEFNNLHNKYIFASFMSRDLSYDLIHKVWKINVTNQGYETLDIDIDDEVDSADSISADSDDDEDGDDDNENRTSNKKHRDSSVNNNDDDGVDSSDTSISDQENMVKDDDKDGTEEKGNVGETASDDNLFNGLKFEGPKTHAATSAGYNAESSDIKIIDDTINAPLGLVYELLFGDDVTFVKNLLKVQKNFDIGVITKFSNKKRSYQYVKPVNGGPIGPKQTRCIVEEVIENKDFNKSCLVVQMTESPDVPSGNAFKVKTKIYLSWGANNSTKIFIVTSIVWSGKSWIKGAIEKGTISGQKEALGILVSELRKKISAGGTASAGKHEKKTKKVKEEVLQEEEVEETAAPPEAVPEPAAPKSYMDILIEQLDLKFVLIMILFIIVITDKFTSSKKSSGYELYSTDRMLMSESNLWEWIEQRELMSDKYINQDPASELSKRIKERNKEPLKKTAKQKMSQQELRDTIEMMEQQLSVLKERSGSSNALI